MQPIFYSAGGVKIPDPAVAAVPFLTVKTPQSVSTPQAYIDAAFARDSHFIWSLVGPLQANTVLGTTGSGAFGFVTSEIMIPQDLFA